MSEHPSISPVFENSDSQAGNDDANRMHNRASFASTVESDITKSSTSSEVTMDRCNLIVNYLPQEIDDASLAMLFSDDGEICSAKVIRDKATKKSLGYGFVKFVNDADAKSSVEAKNGLPIGSKRLKVSFARPASEDIKNCKVYVTNLPKTHDEQSIRELFGRHGEIMECRVLQERKSLENRGVAFIQFANKKQCESALLMDGLELEGSERPLSVKLAEDFKRKKVIRRGGNARNGHDNVGLAKSHGNNRIKHQYMRMDLQDRYVYGTTNHLLAPGSPQIISGHTFDSAGQGEYVHCNGRS